MCKDCAFILKNCLSSEYILRPLSHWSDFHLNRFRVLGCIIFSHYNMIFHGGLCSWQIIFVLNSFAELKKQEKLEQAEEGRPQDEVQETELKEGEIMVPFPYQLHSEHSI